MMEEDKADAEMPLSTRRAEASSTFDWIHHQLVNTSRASNERQSKYTKYT